MKRLTALTATIGSFVMFGIGVGLRSFGPTIDYAIDYQIFLFGMAYVIGMGGALSLLHHAENHTGCATT